MYGQNMEMFKAITEKPRRQTIIIKAITEKPSFVVKQLAWINILKAMALIVNLNRWQETNLKNVFSWNLYPGMTRLK